MMRRGLGGGLSSPVDWWLAIRIANIITNALIAGKDIYDAVKTAKQEERVEQVSEEEAVSVLARVESTLRDYGVTLTSQQRQALLAALTGRTPPPPPPTPAPKKEGIPTWVWLVLGFFGFMMLQQQRAALPR